MGPQKNPSEVAAPSCALLIESIKVSMNCSACYSVISVDCARVLTSSFFVIPISQWKEV